jgi:hypothetical protein
MPQRSLVSSLLKVTKNAQDGHTPAALLQATFSRYSKYYGMSWRHSNKRAVSQPCFAAGDARTSRTASATGWRVSVICLPSERLNPAKESVCLSASNESRLLSEQYKKHGRFQLHRLVLPPWSWPFVPSGGLRTACDRWQPTITGRFYVVRVLMYMLGAMVLCGSVLQRSSQLSLAGHIH